jgi:hypothetical protein
MHKQIPVTQTNAKRRHDDMKQTIGDLTLQFNGQERAWEVVGGDKPQRFQTGPIGKRAAIRFAIRQAYPDVAAAVDRLIKKNAQAAGRAWAAAQMLIDGHVLAPASDTEANHLARVKSQQNGRLPHHYNIGQQGSDLTCTCPDYEAGGVVIGNQGLCKHALAFLLGRHLNWPLHKPETPLPPDVAQLRRQVAGRWRGRIGTQVNGTAARQGDGRQNGLSQQVMPTGIPAYANGEPVSVTQQAAFTSFVAVTGRPPFNSEKLLSWYHGR